MSSQHFVIVGAGPAGGTAAAALRRQGFSGRLTVLGRESYRPYIRPPLSKHYLRGDADRESLYLDEAGWYADNDVRLLTSTVVAGLDLGSRLVHLDHGESLNYDRLLLATGATPRRLDVAGAEAPGVHYLRTLEDSDSLRDELAQGGKRVVLIGSGWIGLEVAASARMLGNEVTILAREAVPLSQSIGDELGGFFTEQQTRHGNVVRSSVFVDSLVAEGGRVSGVRLTDGEIVPADVVIVGIGATPNVDLAQAAGLVLDNGVKVNERLASSDPHVFAAGDVANAFHPAAGVHIRSEHLSNAMKAGVAVAKIMRDEDVVYDDLPTFMSQQFDVTLQFAGYAPLIAGAELVTRGDVNSGSFSVFWLREGRAVAGANVNIPDPEKALQGVIRRTRRIDAAMLRDVDVPLESL